ncbi:MAG: erythromycin esterase family protein [Acidobacteriota bacterium]
MQPDAAIFHTGKQSLRMKFDGTPPGPAVDPEAAVKAWEEIVTHLESGREAYRTKSAATKEIDWAVQNARVVLQCMQMRADTVSRDASMAENIQWILGHSPNAKMVVWAHNGHVATNSVGGYRSMGAALRSALDEQMVIYGFAFNQGSFQAVEPDKGLRSFTVGPSPEGSLDAALAAAEIPLFALDLRQAPASGPAADWLRQPHPARSVGAVYSEAAAAQYLHPLDAMKSFDALLFVGKTTAARANHPAARP